MTESKTTLSTILDSPVLSRIIVGIGEATEITGVSARQLRYWESKNIIKSIGEGEGSNRKYDYSTIEKIILLKDFLDQGYTLEAASRRLEERIQQLNKAIAKISTKSGFTTSLQSSQPITINGQPYIFMGYATHHSTKQRFKIFAPLTEGHDELLAESLD